MFRSYAIPERVLTREELAFMARRTSKDIERARQIGKQRKLEARLRAQGPIGREESPIKTPRLTPLKIGSLNLPIISTETGIYTTRSSSRRRRLSLIEKAEADILSARSLSSSRVSDSEKKALEAKYDLRSIQ